MAGSLGRGSRAGPSQAAVVPSTSQRGRCLAHGSAFVCERRAVATIKQKNGFI